jgi:hypothetical protein
MQFHSFARRRNEITPRATERIIRKLQRTVQLYRTLYFCVSSKEFIVLAVAVGSASGARRRSVVLQPDRRLGIDDVYVHDPRTHHCYRISTAAICLPRIPSGRAGNGAGGRSQWRPRDFRKMGGTQDYIQLDLLGLIAAGFTNVKFQMGSTEGGAYSSAGVSGSGRSVNASTLVGSHGTLNLAHELDGARNHYLGYLRDQGTYCWTNLSFRSTQCSEPHRTPYCWPACSVLRASLYQTVGNAKA